MFINRSFTRHGGSKVFSVLSCIAGLLLLLLPQLALNAIASVLGVGCVIFGVLGIWKALESGNLSMGVLPALFAFFFGMSVWRDPGRAAALLPTAAALFFLYAGIKRVRTSLRRNPEGSSLIGRMGTTGILGLLLILAGLWLLLFPIGSLLMTFRAIGALLILDAVVDFLASRKKSVSGEKRKTAPGNDRHRTPDGAYEAEYRDISDK